MSDIKLDIPNLTVLVQQIGGSNVFIHRPSTTVRSTGSLLRYADSTLTASYAVTASYIEGGATNTGSFTGSFVGDGSGLTGVIAAGVGVNIQDSGEFRGVAEILSFDDLLTASVSDGTASIAVVLPSGIVSASSQATAWTVATSSFSVSSSYAPTSLPNGTVSSSLQATSWTVATASRSLDSDLLDGRDSTTFASTGSNVFFGSQIVTGSVTLSGSLSGATFVQIDTTAVSAGAPGRLTWNDGDGTLDLGLKGGTTTVQLGQELVARVYNLEATTLVDGEVVYISGSQGNRIAVRRASAAQESGSANTIGVVTEPIAPGAEGFITLFGVVRGLNTVGLTPGAVLWLGITPGTYTETRPEAPNHGVSIGYVERVHASVGAIYVKIENGYELDELHDVNVNSTPTYGDLIFRSGSIWVNGRQLSGSYGLTGSLNINGTLSASLVLPPGLVSSSLQAAQWSVATASYVSGAASSWSTLSGIPSGLVSSSVQINTGSFSGSFVGALTGTSSVAVSSSFSTTASAATSITFTPSTASFAVSSSHSQTATSASYFTGSIDFPNGLNVTGSTLSTGGFTGSLQGTSSFAVTASYALNVVSGESSSFATTSSYATVAATAATASYFSGSALFENGLVVTGSLQVTGGITGSFSGSIQNALSSSYAVTASYALNVAGVPDGTVSSSAQIVLQSTSGNLSGSRIVGVVPSASFTETASVATQLQSVTVVTSPIVVGSTYTTVSSGSQHLANGTYIVSCVANTPELTNFRLSGLLSWTPTVATVTVEDEIPTHRSGYTTASVFLRTRATSGSLPTLQLGSDLTLSSSVYTFKFTPVL